MARSSVRRTILSVEALEDRCLLDSSGTLPPNPFCANPPPNLPANALVFLCGNPAANPPANNPPAARAAVKAVTVVVVRFKDADHNIAEYQGDSGRLHNVTQGAMGLVHWVLDTQKEGKNKWLPTGTEEASPPGHIPRHITIPGVGKGRIHIKTTETIHRIEVHYDGGKTQAVYNGNEHKEQDKKDKGKHHLGKGDLISVTQGTRVWKQNDKGEWIRHERGQPDVKEDPPEGVELHIKIAAT